jgi:predicted nucleic acid-binding protein
MSDDFFDTNVLTYLFDETDKRKTDIAQGLIQTGLRTGSGCISFQVVQESLNLLIHKFANPASPDRATRFLDDVLTPLWQTMPSEELYERTLALQNRYRYRFYDSLIIAAALEAGCSRLYSEDLQDGQRIEGLTITNPFA